MILKYLVLAQKNIYEKKKSLISILVPREKSPILWVNNEKSISFSRRTNDRNEFQQSRTQTNHLELGKKCRAYRTFNANEHPQVIVDEIFKAFGLTHHQLFVDIRLTLKLLLVHNNEYLFKWQPKVNVRMENPSVYSSRVRSGGWIVFPPLLRKTRSILMHQLWLYSMFSEIAQLTLLLWKYIKMITEWAKLTIYKIFHQITNNTTTVNLGAMFFTRDDRWR